jgi:hypothetical protein
MGFELAAATPEQAAKLPEKSGLAARLRSNPERGREAIGSWPVP